MNVGHRLGDAFAAVMVETNRQRILYLAIRRAVLTLIAALDEYFGVRQPANGHDLGTLAPFSERV